MARSAKTRSDKGAAPTPPEADAAIPDAEVIAETPAGGSVAGDSAVPAAAPDRTETVEKSVAEPVRDNAGVSETPVAEPVDVTPAEEERADTVAEAIDAVMVEAVDGPPAAEERAGMAAETVDVPAAEPEPAPVQRAAPVMDAPPAPPPVAPVTVKRVGFVPLMLGGVVAAGLGFAAGWQGLLPRPGDDATATALADQAARIDEVTASVAAIPVPDLAPLQAEIAALSADLAPLADRIAALEERLTTMERAPANDGTLSATAIAAWQQDIEDLKAAVAAQADQTAAVVEAAAAREAEMADLQAAMAAQQAEMASMVEAAAQRLDAAESTVAGIEEAATANANATLRRAVLASLQTAVDTGQPFSGLLSELAATGVEAPEGLSAMAADGLATQAVLRETFPEAARAALAAARAEGVVDDGASGVMGFLRSQLDVRSVEPREGDDPDAILSRAEAALVEARLGDALAEIATLPEVVRAPMTDWIAAAEARSAALSALQSLAETLPASDPATSN